MTRAAKINERIHAAVEAGDLIEAKQLANSPEYIAAVKSDAEEFSSRPKTPIDTTAADNSTKRFGYDFERAILARDERTMHSI